MAPQPQQYAGFELREEYAGTVELERDGETVTEPVFQGGVLAADAEGTSFDLAEELKRNDGIVVVSTTNLPLLDTMDRHPFFKRVALPDDFEPVTGYEGLPKGELRERLGDVPGAGRANKETLVAALELRDQALASGDQATADDPIGALERQDGEGEGAAGDAGGDGTDTTQEG